MNVNIYKDGKVKSVDLEHELTALVDKIDLELYGIQIPFEVQKRITNIRNHLVCIRNGVKKT